MLFSFVVIDENFAIHHVTYNILDAVDGRRNFFFFSLQQWYNVPW